MKSKRKEPLKKQHEKHEKGERNADIKEDKKLVKKMVKPSSLRKGVR